MNNSSEICLPTAQHMSIPVLMCLVFFIGFLLNALSLWVFCCRLRSWSAGTVLQFNLALSDALATPVTPLIAVYFAMGNDWHFGRVVCTLKIALLTSQFYGSTFFLTLISVHRYTAVVHYNKSSKMKNKSFIKKLCAGVWLFLLAQIPGVFFVIPATEVGGITQCLSFTQKKLTNTYFIINCVLVSVGFLLPLTISVVCYIRLANTLTRLNAITPKSLKVKLKSQRMIRMCLIIFGICFLPINVTRTIAAVFAMYFPKQCHTAHHVQTAYYASWIVAGLNGCLDPALYCFGSQNFRDAFPSFKKKLTEHQQRGEAEMTQNNI